MDENRNINTTGDGSNTFLAFVLGAVVIAVGIVAFLLFGGTNDVGDGVDVRVEAPQATVPASPPAEPASPPAAQPGGDAPAGGGDTGGGAQ